MYMKTNLIKSCTGGSCESSIRSPTWLIITHVICSASFKFSHWNMRNQSFSNLLGCGGIQLVNNQETARFHYHPYSIKARMHCTINVTVLCLVSLIFLNLFINSTIGLHSTYFMVQTVTMTVRVNEASKLTSSIHINSIVRICTSNIHYNVLWNM